MKIFLIAIYTFNAILIFFLLYRKYLNKMEELNEKEKIYSDNDNINFS